MAQVARHKSATLEIKKSLDGLGAQINESRSDAIQQIHMILVSQLLFFRH
jgi:hypothetical protein